MKQELKKRVKNNFIDWNHPKMHHSSFNILILFLFLLSCSCTLIPLHFCFFPFTCSLLYSLGVEDQGLVSNANASLCSSVPNGTICCDRSSFRSDICIMKGDVRTQSSSSSIFLYTSSRNTNSYIYNVSNRISLQHEKIKPYTRKWEKSIMDTIDELDLISKKQNLAEIDHQCDVKHTVPAVFFSTGGYTGNVYHDFNDGILPLYITSQHLNKKVVFVILQYKKWWAGKYGDIVAVMSDYSPIDFNGDKRTHCFSEAIVGLRSHGELLVNSSLMIGNKSIWDFRNILDRAFMPWVSAIGMKENVLKKPKLVILSRKGSREITNEDSLVKMAKKFGFFVQVLRPNRSTKMARIYGAVNSSDVMIGVHGAAMTHFLFMRPGTVFIQLVPLGTKWPADTCYGEPAKKLGLRYIGYEILAEESSLYDEYERNSPVLSDPNSVNKEGWQFTKEVYLDHQNVKLNLERFRNQLVSAYYSSIAKRNLQFHH